jgi:creatinine amidohydrolase
MALDTIRMEEMSWTEIREAVASGHGTVVVGVGATEQHGPHLPTMTDTRIADALAHRVALKLGDALQARTVAVGVSEHHLAFGGTLSFRPETLKMVLHDYIESLLRCGFRRIVLLPTHGGNFATVDAVIREERVRHPEARITGYADLFGFVGFLNGISAEFGITPEESGAHAGENETSMMMFLEGGRVRADRFAPGYLGPAGPREAAIIMEQGMPALTPNGVLGDPRRASAERGKVYLERLAEFLVREIGERE